MKTILDHEGRAWSQGDPVTFRYLDRKDWKGEIVYFLSANMARVWWIEPENYSTTEYLTHLKRSD